MFLLDQRRVWRALTAGLYDSASSRRIGCVEFVERRVRRVGELSYDARAESRASVDGRCPSFRGQNDRIGPAVARVAKRAYTVYTYHYRPRTSIQNGKCKSRRIANRESGRDSRSLSSESLKSLPLRRVPNPRLPGCARATRGRNSNERRWMMSTGVEGRLDVEETMVKRFKHHSQGSSSGSKR